MRTLRRLTQTGGDDRRVRPCAATSAANARTSRIKDATPDRQGLSRSRGRTLSPAADRHHEVSGPPYDLQAGAPPSGAVRGDQPQAVQTVAPDESGRPAGQEVQRVGDVRQGWIEGHLHAHHPASVPDGPGGPGSGMSITASLTRASTGSTPRSTPSGPRTPPERRRRPGRPTSRTTDPAHPQANGPMGPRTAPLYPGGQRLPRRGPAEPQSASGR